MRILKRFTTSVSSSFDWMISQVENHQALIESAIRDMQHASGKARIQIKRVQKDGEAMRAKIIELEESANVWKERALRIEKEDTTKALECIRRRKIVLQDIQVLEQQIHEHQSFERQLSKDLTTIDQRIAELKRKKNALTAKQYRSEAMRYSQHDELGFRDEVNSILDRWEMRLEDCELCSDQADSFEEAFLSEEEQKELAADLAELRKEQSVESAQQ